MAGVIQHALDFDCSSADASDPAALSFASGIPEAPPPPRERLTLLVRTIERDIIPRLMLAHRDGAAPALAALTVGFVPGEADLDATIGLLLDGDGPALTAQLRRLRDHGATPEVLLLNLLAPAARRLGRMWELDQCDFTIVTMGLWRLQRAMYELSPAFQVDAEPPADGRRILLAPVPGEQHTFGLFMVAEFFRRAGWEVIDAPFGTPEEMQRAVARDWYAVVGVSIACERWIERLRSTIEAVRRHSQNLGVSIIAGGPLLTQRPDLLPSIGADATAADARCAVELAQSMVSVQRLAS